MSDAFVAEIRIFPFNFAPKGWAFCDGQLLPISQNTALFSLLGTTYGGDGKSTFALPDMQGNTVVQPGQGPGLSLYDLGQQGGEQQVTLLNTEMPVHQHALMASGFQGDQRVPTSSECLAASTGGSLYAAAVPAQFVPMASQALPPAGGGLPHSNVMPMLTLNFCIALQGIFPPRG